MAPIEVRPMPPDDLVRIAEIDRTEHITLAYVVEDGVLARRDVDWRVPSWPQDGADDFSVRGLVERWGPILAAGGTLLGAFSSGTLVGFAIHRPDLAPRVSELVALYVDQGARCRGAATALVEEVERLARAAGAASLYVSATPSESAVGFYTRAGFQLARHVNEALAAAEPEDIQMEKRL